MTAAATGTALILENAREKKIPSASSQHSQAEGLCINKKEKLKFFQQKLKGRGKLVPVKDHSAD